VDKMTRSKLLEQSKPIADAKTAFSRDYAGSAIVFANGAGKLQTCATSDGTYTDYATLADGVNNINLDGANLYLKVITSTSAEAVLGDFPED
jgi:hypothetical protein